MVRAKRREGVQSSAVTAVGSGQRVCPVLSCRVRLARRLVASRSIGHVAGRLFHTDTHRASSAAALFHVVTCGLDSRNTPSSPRTSNSSSHSHTQAARSTYTPLHASPPLSPSQRDVAFVHCATTRKGVTLERCSCGSAPRIRNHASNLRHSPDAAISTSSMSATVAPY